MPRLTFAGHPVHPQLVQLPMGLIPASLLFDIACLKTGKKSYAEAAYASLLGAYIGALAAALPGLADYFEISTGSETKRTANAHLLLNVTLLGLTGLNLLRRSGKKRIDAVDVALSAAGNGILLASGWYGWQLVYKHGMRVEGREIDHTPEWRLPGDSELEDALTSIPETFVERDERMPESEYLRPR